MVVLILSILQSTHQLLDVCFPLRHYAGRLGLGIKKMMKLIILVIFGFTLLACSDGDGSSTPSQLSQLIWYQDADNDKYGKLNEAVVAGIQPSGYVADSTDCNDSDAAINPSATETHNSVDDNCDGNVDEGFSEWFRDSDEDGYGDPSLSVFDTSKPNGYVADNTDCNDSVKTTNPGATQEYDGIDNNCDGNIDEGFLEWFQDDDSDTFGNPDVSVFDTTKPTGYVADSTDCNDNDDSINPGLAEVPNDDKDNNCDQVFAYEEPVACPSDVSDLIDAGVSDLELSLAKDGARLLSCFSGFGFEGDSSGLLSPYYYPGFASENDYFIAVRVGYPGDMPSGPTTGLFSSREGYHTFEFISIRRFSIDEFKFIEEYEYFWSEQQIGEYNSVANLTDLVRVPFFDNATAIFDADEAQACLDYMTIALLASTIQCDLDL